MDKNVACFGVANSSSVHADNRKANILFLGECPADELGYATITAETKYSINVIKSRKKVCLSLHYNGSNSLLYANGVKKYYFKAKDLEIKPYPFCFGDTSKYFAVNNMKKQS